MMTESVPCSFESEASALIDRADLDGIGPINAMAWSPFFEGLEKPPLRAVTEQLIERRLAVRDLGRAVRATGEASVMTEVATPDIARAKDLIAEACTILQQHCRSDGETSSVDDPYHGIRMSALLSGEASPLIRPLIFELRDGVATAHCILGSAFEGPPRHVHGGVSSMLMDQALGYAVASSGNTGLTRKLTVEYRAPVPVGVELRICGKVVAAGEVDVFANGWITTVVDPSVRLVAAEGQFRRLRTDQARALIESIV